MSFVLVIFLLQSLRIEGIFSYQNHVPYFIYHRVALCTPIGLRLFLTARDLSSRIVKNLLKTANSFLAVYYDGHSLSST